jgi:hypothetical protein
MEKINRPLTKEEQQVIEALRRGPNLVSKDALVHVISTYGLSKDSWVDKYFFPVFMVLIAGFFIGGTFYTCAGYMETGERIRREEAARERARDPVCEKEVFVKCLEATGAAAESGESRKSEAIYACRSSATEVCLRKVTP